VTRELARRIAITIGALLIFRLGSFIPLAGISIQSGALSSAHNGAVSIFSLSLIPYLTAAIIIQLVAVVWGRLRALERSGEAGRRKIARYTLILTLVLAASQAYGIASAVQGIRGLVLEPGGWFLLSATASMVGGVFCLIWLSEQITRHGIGNGLALILSVSILVSFPAEVALTFELLRQGAVSGDRVLLCAILWAAVVAVIVLFESARRNVPVNYSARQLGQRLLPQRSSVLSIKLNSAGFLIPFTVAPWVFYLPLALASLVFGRTSWLAAAYQHIQFGRPVHIALVAVVILVLTFVYTAYVLDPEHAAETLRDHGGVIPNVAPGEPTADYLDRMASLTTVVGAVYLVAVSLIPEVLVADGVALPYKIGGGSMLIVVCTILDIKKQVYDLSLVKPGG
jgi:preprotein translocase subunit SecY